MKKNNKIKWIIIIIEIHNRNKYKDIYVYYINIVNKWEYCE